MRSIESLSMRSPSRRISCGRLAATSHAAFGAKAPQGHSRGVYRIASAGGGPTLSGSRIHRHRLLPRVVVEATARLSPVMAGVDQLLERRGRGEAIRTVGLVHHGGD